jgi:hypothetical protein
MADNPAALLIDVNGNPLTTFPVSPIGVPPDPSKMVAETLKDDSPTPSEDLRVDGSVTPVDFEYGADPDDDVALLELRFVLSADSIYFEGSKFGPISALANGIKVIIMANSEMTILHVLKINEHFLSMINPASLFRETTGSADAMAAAINFGGLVKLKAGTGDYIKVMVQDDLTSVKFKYFTATLWAYKEST